MPAKPKNIDEYIGCFPKEKQLQLNRMRSIVNKTIPHGKEVISYAIPAVCYKEKPLVYYTANKNHIGMYPVPNTAEFEKDYSGYKTSGKGTIQFPLNEPLPQKLIIKIIIAMMKEYDEKILLKSIKK